MAVYLPLAVQVCVFTPNIRPGQDRKRVRVCVWGGGQRKEIPPVPSFPPPFLVHGSQFKQNGGEKILKDKEETLKYISGYKTLMMRSCFP